MKPTPRFACLLAMTFALAACQGEKKATQPGTAQGEVLPGSASDAMLPYDTIRSQPPLAPMPTGAGKAGAKADGGKADEASAEGSEAASEASTAPAPAPQVPEPKAAQ